MSATPELAILKSARAVMTTEVDEGTFLSESLIKQMTGEDPISARHCYGVPFDFLPSFKLFVAGNHKLVIRGTDIGIWRRLHLIPFEITIPPEKRDTELPQKLRAELPGILNWALAGCLKWQELRELAPPAAVTAAVAEYKEDMDLLGQWLDETCEVGLDLTNAAGDAYFSYKCWAERSGLKQWSLPIFGRKLKERFRSERTSGCVQYFGFRVRVLPATIEKAKVPGFGAM